MTRSRVERLVAGSGFHTANGLAFGPDGKLFVASVVGRCIFSLDLDKRDIAVMVPPPRGVADDLVVTTEGDLIWTALLDGAVRMESARGVVRDLATDLPGVNSIALTRDGKRLFVGQVFKGEGVWEIDLAGRAPPRLVVDGTGGLNACQFGPDGWLYGPSWDRGLVIRIHPETGATEILSRGMKHPGAVRFDSRDRLYVLDDATGELFRIKRDGERNLLATLAPATDNFVFDEYDRAYVSNMADNSICQVDPQTGVVREIVRGSLAFPSAIAIAPDDQSDLIHVADGCAYRTVDPRTGVVTEVARSVVSTLVFPTSVSANNRHVVLASDVMGVVQIVDRSNGRIVETMENFEEPGAAIELENGDIIVSEPAAGCLLRVRGEKREVLVEALSEPIGLLDDGDGGIFVAESGSGRLLSVDLATCAVREVATGCGAIRTVCAASDGRLVMLDTVARRVLLFDPRTQALTELAADLAVGHLVDPYPRSGGLAVGSNGAIYVAADRDNAIDRIREL